MPLDKAFQENDVDAIEEGFNAYLKKTISIRDTNVKKEMKENFYHGILLGLFGNMDDGMKTIYRYGIACYKKRCKVVSG